MIGNRFYTWFKNYYQWVGGAFNETLLLPLVRATAGLRAGAIRYDETTNTVETYDGTNWNAIPSASGFVPYTGATQDVNLGEQGLEAGYLQLDTTPTGTPADQGTIYWDIDAETAALIMNGTVQKVGEDVFFHVQNKTGSPIAKGTAVRFAGTDGNSGKILIAPFLANGTYPSQYFMGVTSETIADGAFGKVYHFGKIRGVNTQSYNAGDILYASTTIAGGFQTTPPVAPNNIIVVAAVISKANNGTLMIRSTLGSNINNDEGVLISGAANGQGLFYENGLWKNKTIATVLGYTPGTVSSVGIVTGSIGTDINVSGSPVTVSGNITLNIPTASATNRGALSSSDWTTFNNKVSTSRQLTINGTAFDLSADRSWSVGTVTSVAASAPLSVSGSATTTPVITISQANSTTNGFLSSTDWNTFNNKQNTLSLTTTGNSGASTLVGSTLNVPEYTISGLGGVPTTRQLTINGTAFDLSANRSWSVGTVTSVGLTSSTSGVTITDSPVTVSGTISIAIATANGSQQGLLSSTDWTTFNNKQNTISLTTTGTSGAATLIGATLNVPQYQAQGNYITSLTGEATASGPGAASVTLSTTAVTGKLLTGLNLSGGGTIAATDSILTAFGKVQNQISAMVGGVMYQGTWNASTNTPTLTSSVGVKGYYYIVDVSGTTSLNGISDWRVGDWAIFNGSTWDKVDNTDAVSSVNGFTGAVSLTTSHIAEGTNLYYLDSRSRTAISLTTTGNSGAATYDNVSGIINVPQYTLTGLGGVPTTRQLTINGTAFDLSADRSWSVGTVTSVGLNSTTSGITITNTPVTSSGALTINIATASGSQNGLLSSSDWTTFNNKQNALTNPVTGTGTTGQVAYFNGTTSITGESNLFWDASNDRLGIGINTPSVIQHLYAGLSGSALFYTRYTSVDGADIRFGKNFGATDTNNAILGTWSNNAIDFYTNSTLAARLDASGRLGIGTQTPDFPLDVVRTSTGTVATFGIEGQTINPRLRIDADEANNTVTLNPNYNGSTSPALVFKTQEAERMRITSGGNVGIGTSSPVYRMHIVNSGNTLLQLNGNNTAGTLDTGFTISADDSKNIYLYQRENADTIFGTNNTERMRISAAGNVGIGSTTPNLLTWNRAVTINTATGNSALELSIGDAAQAYFAADASDIFLAAFANKNLKLRTNNADRMTITSGGNVGIGTNSPATALDVAGVSTFRNTGVPAIRLIRDLNVVSVGPAGQGIEFLALNGSTPTVGAAIFGALNNPATTGRFDFQTLTSGSLTSKLVIDYNGNVGIGTSSPGNQLTVYRTSSSTSNGALLLDGNGNYAGVQFAGSGTIYGSLSVDNVAMYMTHGNSISFRTGSSANVGGTDRVTITSGGNVGIGTANATGQSADNRALQIYGAGFANRAQIHFVNSNTGEATGDGTFIGIDSSTNFYINNAESAATIFENGGSERMRITSGGEVGIGTSSPVTRLTVNGGSANTSTNYQFKNFSAIGGFAGGYTNSAIVSLLAGYDGASYYSTDIGYYFDTVGYGMTFSTNPNYNSGTITERMRIQSDGNVAIGTTSTVGHRLTIVSPSGADREILQAGVSGVSNGFRVLWNHSTLKTHVSITDIPTSSAGLPAGTLYSDGGTIKIA